MGLRAKEELGELTNPIFAVGEKLPALLPGIDPFNLFLSNLSSTRFCSFPRSGGICLVKPLEWKFLHESNEAVALGSGKTDESNQRITSEKTKTMCALH
jgi:hypothetical protein